MNTQTIRLIAICLFMTLASRLLPHLPNVTPVLALAVFLAQQLRSSHVIIVVILMMFISDAALAWQNGWALLGSWSLFTYTAMAIIVLATRYSNWQWRTLATPIGQVSALSLFYWLWTNLGTWLFSTMYPHTIEGLIACYTAALPFLANSLCGDVFWACILFYSYRHMAINRDNTNTNAVH